MKLFKTRKDKALEAFGHDLKALEDDRNHNDSWTNGFSENIRTYIGEKSPLYEGAKGIRFWYMATKREETPYRADQYVRQAIQKINTNGVTNKLGVYDYLSRMEQWKVISGSITAITVIFSGAFALGVANTSSTNNKAVLDKIDIMAATIKTMQNDFAIINVNDMRIITRIAPKLDSTLNSILYRLDSISDTNIKTDTLGTS